MTELTLVTRDGCHLCDAMKAVVAQVQRHRPVQLTEVDISTRPDLQRRYDTEIPVLLRGDHVIAQQRISVSQLIVALSGA